MDTILVDTNILVYAYDPRDAAKSALAQQLLRELRRSKRGVLSVQTLVEFARVTQKLAIPSATALSYIQAFAASWTLLSLTPPVVIEAMRGVHAHALAYYDAQIWAIARLNQISVVFSEDFSSGAILDGVRFINPFSAEFMLDQWL